MSIYIGRKRMSSVCVKCKKEAPKYIVEPRPVCTEERLGKLMEREKRKESKVATARQRPALAGNCSAGKQCELTAGYTVLLHRGIFSPCCGCRTYYACSPSTCDMLAKWL